MSTNTTPIYKMILSIYGKRVHFNLEHLGWTMEQRSIAEYVGRDAMFKAITEYLTALEMVPAFNLADNQEYVEQAEAHVQHCIDYLIGEIKERDEYLIETYNFEQNKFGAVDDQRGELFEVNNQFFNIRAEVCVSAHQE